MVATAEKRINWIKKCAEDLMLTCRRNGLGFWTDENDVDYIFAWENVYIPNYKHCFDAMDRIITLEPCAYQTNGEASKKNMKSFTVDLSDDKALMEFLEYISSLKEE